MTTITVTAPRVTIRLRLRKIGLAMFGPADSGPYGPPVPPPARRPRDHRGRLIKEPKLK